MSNNDQPDPRDVFLQNVVFDDIEVREYPKIAFLCGGSPRTYIDTVSEHLPKYSLRRIFKRIFSSSKEVQSERRYEKQVFPSVRSYISTLLTIKYTKIKYQNAEDIKDWNSYSVYDDLIEFENDIAHICKAIVLFVESEGSIAELGAFSIIPEIKEKLIIFVHAKHSDSTSYVSLGPLKRIKDTLDGRVHYIEWALEDSVVEGVRKKAVIADSIKKWGDYTCGEIESFLDRRLHLKHSESDITRTIEAFYIHDLVRLFMAVSEDEMAQYFKSVSHHIKKKELTRSIFCLEKLGLIIGVTRGNKTYYIPGDLSEGRLLRLNSGVDSARLSVQLDEYYQHHTQFARREAIDQAVRGGL